MKKMVDGVQVLTDLQQAYDGSYYFIAGAGGDLQEWVNGYNEMLKEREIGEPVEWFQTTGAAVNHFAEHGGYWVSDQDHFPDDLPCLLFPLVGLEVGRLSMFKLLAQDRWFDDVIDNMR